MTLSAEGRDNNVLNLAAGPWIVIDDGVMGGRSAGQVAEHGGTTVFSGTLSLENNGGFSSIRLALRESLDGFSGIRLKVRGDGRNYQLRLREGRRFDGVSWSAEFDAEGDWITVEIPFELFRPGFRGRSVPQAGPVVAQKISQIGILLGDKIPGKFRLEIGAMEGMMKEGR